MSVIEPAASLHEPMLATTPPGAGRPAERLSGPGLVAEVLRQGFALDRGIMPRLTAHDITRARIGTRRFVVLKRPEHVDHVFHAGRLNYVKSLEFEGIRRTAGLNLLTDEGDSWAAHRGAISPMFAKRRLNGLVDLMEDPIAAMIEDLLSAEGRTVVDIHEVMVQMTLRVVANALFSQDFGEVVENMHAIATRGLTAVEILARFTFVGALPRPGWWVLTKMAYSKIPAPPPFRVLQLVSQGMDRAVNDVLTERAANPTDTPDLLNLLLEADGGQWGQRRVRDEALTFMLAGHETTANALSWFWYLMALHPQARDRMLEEIDSVLGGQRPTADQLGELPWTTACIQESQRYFSAVPFLSRTAIVDDVIDGHHIRKGTTVLIPIHAIHHDPRNWADPDEFDPQRFMPDAPKNHRSAFLPFGGGRRVCIGQSFALMEMVAIAAMMSQRFTFDLEPGHPVTVVESMTLRPGQGIRMVARRRVPRGLTSSPAIANSASDESACPFHAESSHVAEVREEGR